MNFVWIGFLGTVFVGLTFINRTIEGTWISTTDVAILNQMSLMQKVDIGFTSLPVPNTSFLSGLYHLMQGDYSFFGGNGQMIYFLFQSITFMVSFMLLITIIGIAINAIRGR